MGYRLRRGIALIVAAGLLSGTATAQDRRRQVGVPAAALEEASQIAAAGRAEQEIPGLSLVVMQGDELLLARGHGVEATHRSDPVTAQTVFSLGSISKQFVASAIMKLVEEGKLRLDDPVARHLPEFTRLPPGLRVEHLLSHTSGLREEFRQPLLVELFAKPGTTFAQYAAAARGTPADFAPGSRWSYSNVNYLILTLIVEKIANRTLEAELSSRFFRPLGLRSIALCENPLGDKAGEARGHIRRDGKLVGHPDENIQLFKGSGGYCGNAVDLARWTRALATGRVVSPASYRLMSTKAPLSSGGAADYGFGLALVSPDGIERIGHGGYGGGASAQAAYYPDRQITLVLLTNRFVFPEHVERRIARRLHGLPELQWRERPMTAEQRAAFAGSFELGVEGWHARVVETGGGLQFELPSPPMKLPLMHVGDNLFVNRANPYGYQLRFSPDGSAMELLGMGLMRWYGTKLPPAQSQRGDAR